jgi:O-antigen/teichoic acid export membrane protein
MMSRYLTAMVEQALWAVLNLGVNLLLIRLITPEQYGAFAFWAACGFVLSSIQNAVSICHFQVVPPGGGLAPHRLEVERLMHGVNAIFLVIVGVLALTGSFGLGAFKPAMAAPAAALYLPAFLLQQYFRALSYSRGQPANAAIQTGTTLLAALGMLGVTLRVLKVVDANEVLAVLGLAYGTVGVLAALRVLPQQLRVPNWPKLRLYRTYLKQSGWIFLGVASTEILARFYAFVAPFAISPAGLASLSATNLSMRPIALLASSWSLVARPDLVHRLHKGDRAGAERSLGLALAGGLVVTAGWAVVVYLSWPLIAHYGFAGRYGADRWMLFGWAISAAIGLGQVVFSSGIQAFRAFKPLALANATASAVGAIAVLAGTHWFGAAGAIGGTALGNAAELLVMAAILVTLLRPAAKVLA